MNIDTTLTPATVSARVQAAISSDSAVVPDPQKLRSMLGEKLKALAIANGTYQLPCLPSMLDEYVALARSLMKVLGQVPTPEKMEAVRKLLAEKIETGFHESPNARLVLSFRTNEPRSGLAGGVTFQAQVKAEPLANRYQAWMQGKKEPLFGAHPDAKVLHVASQLGHPRDVPVLDVGAGVGRNSLPLARLGHPVDAVELTPAFAEELKKAADREALSVRTIVGNVLDPLLRVGARRYRFAFAAEVISHFRHNEQVRLFLAKMCDALHEGGMLLFSTFLAIDGYVPDRAVREFAEAFWCYTMTRREFEDALAGLPLEILSDESALTYEKAHAAPGTWPPTHWYEAWASGRNVIPTQNRPPLELRWILARRTREI